MDMLGLKLPRILVSRTSSEDHVLAGYTIPDSGLGAHKTIGFFDLSREIRDKVYDWLLELQDPIIRPISGPRRMNSWPRRVLRAKSSSDTIPTYKTLHARKLYAEIAGHDQDIPQYLHPYQQTSSKEPMYVKYTNAVCAHALTLNKRFCKEALERVEWWALPTLRVLKMVHMSTIPTALLRSKPRRMGVTFAIGCPLVPIARDDVQQTLLGCLGYTNTLIEQLPLLDHLAAAIFVKHDGNYREALDFLGPTSPVMAALPRKGVQLKHLWLGIDCAAVYGKYGQKSGCTMRISWNGSKLVEESREGDLKNRVMQRTGVAKPRVVFRVEESVVEGIARRLGRLLSGKRG